MTKAPETSIARQLSRHDILQATIDALPHLVWICQSDGNAAYFDARWLEYTGLAMRQLWGRGWTETASSEGLNGIYWALPLSSTIGLFPSSTWPGTLTYT